MAAENVWGGSSGSRTAGVRCATGRSPFMTDYRAVMTLLLNFKEAFLPSD